MLYPVGIPTKKNLFRFAEKIGADIVHFLFGIFLVFFCNSMVIIGIFADMSILLVPWIIIYGAGKNCAFYQFSLTFTFSSQAASA